MDTWVWVAILGAVAVVVVAAALWLAASRKRQSTQLQERFGPEYEHAVRESGSPRKAESELKDREKRVEKLEIRPLSDEEYEEYSQEWMTAQARFVDEPREGVAQAERLIKDVMSARGYPMGDFEQRAADISVDHPKVVANYRFARRISESAENGEATTEDLRQAMVHYRALFAEILEKQPARR